MEKNKKNLWSQIAAILLIAGMMTVLLWGCTDGRNSPMPTKPNPTQDTNVPLEPEILDTTAKVVAYTEEMVQSGAQKFSLVCSQDVYDMLMKVMYREDGMEIHAYHSLLAQSGLYSYHATTAGMKRTITVTNISRYPGYEIIRSIEAGKEETLSTELRKTLAEARSMAEACRTSDPLQTAKNIQSSICARVSYAAMTNKSIVDTAVGALLNAVADCDGYSDAFYLVGSLAGLEIRYQHGISSEYDHENHKIITGSHMWNLLKLDGSWRVVDVCWADGVSRENDIWFNIGKDRASRSRAWREELTVPLLETTDLSTRPETEYSVLTYEDLEEAVRKALEKEQACFTIIFDGKNYSSAKDALVVTSQSYTGEFYYYWDEGDKAITICLGHYEG